MPRRTKESARRVPNKPYDFTRPRPCIMRASSFVDVSERAQQIVSICRDLFEDLGSGCDVEHLDEYERMRHRNTCRSVRCIEVFANSIIKDFSPVDEDLGSIRT
ncbi:hypothetical protein DSLPV1_225 [Dishui lake phycodnavirus 1]|uniref:hypothetical protein n=1 Tax=Dishui lake phycodnavirus 1 TaxID=2079134 RepID=UPI000CD6AEC6|nr:hypothetical protein C5Y57_gp173 [Dishui lake phycodnavirus 1]AUT19196.1 hypothetical protein DSLPV1_225 [Dishui lake phycodnavirus 1]